MCILFVFSFLGFLQPFGRHMLQRVLLQYWQKVQSGQGFFFKTPFLSISQVYALVCVRVKLKGDARPSFAGILPSDSRSALQLSPSIDSGTANPIHLMTLFVQTASRWKSLRTLIE